MIHNISYVYRISYIYVYKYHAHPQSHGSSFNLRVFVTQPSPPKDMEAWPASGTRRRLLPKAGNIKKWRVATKTHRPNLPPELNPAWARPANGRPVSHPSWAENIVTALREAGMLQVPKSLSVNLWSDCGGMVAEKIAWVDIRLALEQIGYKVDLNLYCACENDPAAKKIIEQNHDPRHYTDDILLDRDLKAGTYMCSKCGVRHEFPKTGIDIYVGSYPCTPWTRRGTRTGFQHHDAQCFVVGIGTVFTLKPCVWAFETTEGVDDHRPHEEETNLAKIQEYIQQQMSVHEVEYVGEVVRKLHPTWFSYPGQRPRVFGLYWRKDMGPKAHLTRPLNILLQQPLPMEHTYFTLLNLEANVLDWSRFGQFPTEEEMGELKLRACVCGVDSMIVCRAHPCKCGHCGRSKRQCKWRATTREFLAQNFREGELAAWAGQLTYVDVLALNGRPGPKAPRERILLNIVALLPKCQPLQETLAIADRGQTITRISLRSDGTIPTVATNSLLHCFRTGECLQTYEVAALMGLKLERLRLAGVSAAAIRKRLGLGIHVAVMGAMELCLMAPLL